jgi:hypothetical protein
MAVALYGGLVGSVFTGLYEPLSQGRDDSWAVAVLVVCAHLGLGLGIARGWALVFPVVSGIALAVAADELGILVLVFVMPALAVMTALGWGLSVPLGRRAVYVASGTFAVALWPAAWAASEQLHRARAEYVPAAVQARLPTDFSLGNLCPGTETPPSERRDLRRQAERLIRELQRHPGDLVTYTYYLADEGRADRVDITVREVAQEELESLRTNGGSKCEPELQRRLREGIG